MDLRVRSYEPWGTGDHGRSCSTRKQTVEGHRRLGRCGRKPEAVVEEPEGPGQSLEAPPT